MLLLNCIISDRGVILLFSLISNWVDEWYERSSCVSCCCLLTSHVVDKSVLALWKLLLTFFCLFISANLSVSKLQLLCVPSAYMFVWAVCLCEESSLVIHRHCLTATLTLLNHFSRNLFCFVCLFVFYFFTLFNVVSLPFASAASGACLGKTSCVTPHPPAILFSIHL